MCPAKAGAGVFDVIAGGGTFLTAGALCPVTGLSCFVSAGGGALALIGGDNVQAGLRTAWSGNYTPTVGAQLLSRTTGLSLEWSEGLYGFSTLGVGAAQKGVQALTVRYATQAELEAARAAALAKAACEGDSVAARAESEAGVGGPCFIRKLRKQLLTTPLRMRSY